MKLKYRLVELIKNKGWTKGAEIGVAKGGLLFSLLEYCPDLHMIGVDTWMPIIGNGSKKENGYRGYDDCNQEMRWFKVALRATQEYPDRLKIMRMDSLLASELIPDESMDFVYIDADHRLSYVRADLAVWWPKVKFHGYLFGHDLHLPTVKKAVINAFLYSWSDFGDNVWMREKRI